MRDGDARQAWLNAARHTTTRDSTYFLCHTRTPRRLVHTHAPGRMLPGSRAGTWGHNMTHCANPCMRAGSGRICSAAHTLLPRCVVTRATTRCCAIPAPYPTPTTCAATLRGFLTCNNELCYFHARYCRRHHTHRTRRPRRAHTARPTPRCTHAIYTALPLSPTLLRASPQTTTHARHTAAMAAFFLRLPQGRPHTPP